jgi:hypothetical protein
VVRAQRRLVPKNATGKVLKRELRRLHARPSP